MLFLHRLVSHWTLTASLAAPSKSLSYESNVFLLCSQYSSTTFCPWSSYSRGAKLTASEQLKPQSNPEWYAPGKTRTNSQRYWTQRYTGIPSAFNMEHDSCITCTKYLHEDLPQSLTSKKFSLKNNIEPYISGDRSQVTGIYSKTQNRTSWRVTFSTPIFSIRNWWQQLLNTSTEPKNSAKERLLQAARTRFVRLGA